MTDATVREPETGDDNYTQAALQALKHTIGPSPWYWNTFPWITGVSGQRYLWIADQNDPIKLASVTDAKAIRLAIGMYAWPFAMPNGVLGICEPQLDHKRDTSSVRVRCFNPDDLPEFVLSDSERSAAMAKNTTTKGEPLGQFLLPGNLARGSNTFECPDIFRDAADLLVVANCRRKEDPSVNVVLYRIRFNSQTVESYPQDWFTSDAFDLGYQWITRVTRHPDSGRFIGDGIRIGTFELNASGCGFERWLRGGPTG